MKNKAIALVVVMVVTAVALLFVISLIRQNSTTPSVTEAPATDVMTPEPETPTPETITPEPATPTQEPITYTPAIETPMPGINLPDVGSITLDPTSTPFQPQSVRAGDSILFGRYEQDGNSENGPEAIEWTVLAVQNGNALLISRYGLDAKPYNSDRTDVTWETCSLRTWLNSVFFQTAFSSEEQSAILLTDVDNSEAQGYPSSISGGNNTQDRVFLLSYAEADRYYGIGGEVSITNLNTAARMAPTSFAVKQGAWVQDNGNGAGSWWLRSPGHLSLDAARVICISSLRNFYVDSRTVCVRPVIWVNLDSDIFR